MLRVGFLRLLAIGLVLLPALISPWIQGGVSHAVHYWLCALMLAANTLAIAVPRVRCLKPTLSELVVLSALLLAGLQAVYVSADRDSAPQGMVDSKFVAEDFYAGISVSCAPAETRLVVSRIWLAVAALILVSRLINEEHVPFLLAAIALNGALIAAVGIVQRLGGLPTLFWESPPENSGFGPFFNRNNAGGYLVCSLVAGLYLVLSRQATIEGMWQSDTFRNNTRIISFTIVITIVGGILMTFCRGAYVALVAGSVVLLAGLLKERSAMQSLAVISLLVATSVGLLFWVDLHGAVQARFGEISEGDAQGLVHHWADDLRMVSDYWRAGCGLGAYRFVNRSYQSFVGDKWFAYSENQYLEILIAMGIPGLVLLLAIQGVLLVGALRLYSSRIPHLRDFGLFGLLFLVTNAITAFFDFGFCHSSNLLLLAIQGGVVVQFFRQGGDHAFGHKNGWQGGVILLILFAVGVFAVGIARNHAAFAAAMGGNPYRVIWSDDPPESRQEVDLKIANMHRSLEACPYHPTGNLFVSRLLLDRFRFRLYEKMLLEFGKADHARLWEATSPEIVAARLRGLKERDRGVFQDAISRSEMEDVRRAIEFADRSIASCAFQPRAYLQRARLLVLLDEKGAAVADLKKCLTYAPLHPELHVAASSLAVSLGERTLAATWLANAIQFGIPIDEEVGRLLATYWEPTEFLASLPDSEDEVVMRIFLGKGMGTNWATVSGDKILARWSSILDTRHFGERESRLGCFAGEVLEARRQLEKALECYQQVLANRESVELVGYRFRYAELLLRAKRPAESLKQLDICCRQSSNKHYRRRRNQIIDLHIRSPK